MKIKKFVIFLMIVALVLPVFGSARDAVSSSESRVSMVELFTATWCTFCPAAEKAVSDEFASENGKFIFVAYHLGDPFATKDTTNRGYFYGVTGTPTALVNGKYKFIGTSQIKSVGLSRAVSDSEKVPTVNFSKIDTFIANNDVNVEIVGKNSGKNSLNLFVLLVEDNVQYKGKTYRFVVRKIKKFGESSDSFEENASFGILNNYNQNELYVVAFAQDTETSEIYQAKEVKVSNDFNAPLLTQPKTEITTFPYSINFKETPLSEGYEVQFATDKLFYAVVRDENIDKPPYIIGKKDLISGKYFVRVRALKNKIRSPWSNVISLDIKVLETIVMKIGEPFMEVDGVSQEIDPGRGTVPVIISKWSRTVVPIRAIVEALGGDVEWDAPTKTIAITLTKREPPPAPPTYTIYIVMQIDNPRASVNGIKRWIDDGNHNVAPIIINNRTMVPIRFVMQTLGCKVEWDPDKKEITIIFEE